MKETPFYGDTAIKSDESVKAHRDKIYTKILRVSIFIFVNFKKKHVLKYIIKQKKQKEMCGGSVFKAARIDSTRNQKSDETGMILSACRHGIIKGAINMHHGETFTHTHFMHHLCWEQKCKFYL